MSTSLLVLSRECPDRLGWYAQGAPSSGTSTRVWVHDAAGSHFDEVDEPSYWENVWAKVEADSAGSPQNVGEIRRVKTYTPGSASFSLATGRGFTSTPTPTMTVGFYKAVPPGTRWGSTPGWTHYINRVLRSIRYRRYSILSLVTDGDMETSGVTNWTATSATLTKITAAANLTLGSTSLRVANSGTNGLARSALINVAPGDTYSLRADLRVASGTGELEAYDQTNSAVIESETSTYPDWRYLAFNFTIPTGCLSLSIRLKGQEATADVYWDNVSLRHTKARQMDLPSWVDNPGAVEGLYQYRGGAGVTAGADAGLWMGQHLTPIPYDDIIAEVTAATAYRIAFSWLPKADALLMVRGLGPHAELSVDADTTVADKDLVELGACALAAADHEDPRAEQFLADYNARLPFLPYAERWIASGQPAL